jgi:5-deoxy-D-glucuronate isomerase
MNAATPETAALGALDAADANALADDGFELLTEEETQEPGDPIEEEISAYLDGELTPEERGAFEEKIALQPELKARVEAERRAWDALDALDADSPNFELTEKTVDRLNSETQAELKALDAQETRRRNLYRTVGLAGAAAVQAEESAEEAVETVSGAESTDSEAEEETVSKDIKVWVSEETKAFTEEKIKDFLEGNDALKDYTVTVEAVNELDAPKKMRADVENGADIYTFPQDELATLVAAEALTPAGDTSGWVIEQNDEGAVNAATIADTIYAYPMTADNGYFLYYDKSVILDTSTLEGILADCEGAGKTFYFELTGGWYQTAFFFATGCDAVYGTDLNGKFTSANFTYASDEGLEALKGLIALSNSPAFRNGSSIKDAKDCAAIVDGTWDSAAAK